MSTIHKCTFSLPKEQLAFIDEKVKSGQFASGSEVVRAGLRALQERNDAVERWLNTEVAETYDAAKEARGKILSVGDAFDQIRAKHAAAAKKQQG